MPKTRNSYPLEYRQKRVELVQAGRNPDQLAREFEPSPQTIRNWVVQAQRDAGRRTDGLSSTERDDLGRPRREVKQLRIEREILSKATAWFAKETESASPRRSTS